MTKYFIEALSFGGFLLRIETMANNVRSAIEHDKSVLYSFTKSKYADAPIDVILIGHNPRLTVDSANSLLDNCENEAIRLHLVNTSLDLPIEEMMLQGIKKGVSSFQTMIGESVVAAVNSVMDRMKSDIVVVLFAGVLVSNNWLEAILKEFEDFGVGIVFPLSSYDLDMLPGWDYRSFAKMISSYSDGIPLACFVSSRAMFAVERNLLIDLVSKPSTVSHGEVADLFMQVHKKRRSMRLVKDFFHFDMTVRSDYISRWALDNKSGFSVFYEKWKKELEHFSSNSSYVVELKKLAETINGLERNAVEFSEMKKSVVFVFNEVVVCGAVLAACHLCNKLIEHGYNAFFACTRLDRNESRKLPMKFEPLVCESEMELIKAVRKMCPEGYVIAPIWTAVEKVVKICDCNKKLKPIYYVQDDERLFVIPSGQLQNDQEVVGNFYTEISNVVSNSIWVRNFLKNDFGVDSVRIGIGVDSLMFYPREKSNDVIIIMAHCRLSTPRRGWEFIKQVLNEVSRNRNVGICLYDEVDESFIQHNSWVTNHRKISPHQLSQLMGEAHIFIEGSIIQGWGMQALEAMSSGCTLISTDNKGIDSFGTSGLDCLIVPHGDVALAASLICKMVDEKDTRYFLSSHARNTAIRFDWDQIVKAWLYYFKSLEV